MATFLLHIMLFLFLVYITTISIEAKVEDFLGDAQLKNYPKPFTANNRILGMVLTYNTDHIDPLMLIFNEYVSMCEAGWNPTIVLFSIVGEYVTVPIANQQQRIK